MLDKRTGMGLEWAMKDRSRQTEYLACLQCLHVDFAQENKDRINQVMCGHLSLTDHRAELIIFTDSAHTGRRKCRAIERISHNNHDVQYLTWGLL